MDIKTAIYAYLQTKTLLTALISTRLYPGVAEQVVTKPYVVFEVADDQHERHLSGASALANYMITFTVHAATVISRDDVSEALRNILHTRKNISLTGSIDMRSATLETRFDSSPTPADGTENGLFQAELDFTIILFETLPTLP